MTLSVQMSMPSPNRRHRRYLEFKDLFDNNTIGKLHIVYHIRLDYTVFPTVCAPRCVPLAMRDKIGAAQNDQNGGPHSGP